MFGLRPRRFGGWMGVILAALVALSSASCGGGEEPREEMADAAKQAARDAASRPESAGSGGADQAAGEEPAPESADGSADGAAGGSADGSADRSELSPPDASADAPAAGSSGAGGPGEAGSGGREPAPAQSAPSTPQMNLPPVADRRPIPEFQLKNLAGETVGTADLKGKVVLLNFWATWCPPCRAEIPDFIELQRELGPKGFEVVGISLDDKGAVVVQPFAQQQRINYTMLVGGHPVAQQFGGIRAIPTSFLVDKHGRAVVMKQGLAPKQYWKELASALLAES